MEVIMDKYLKKALKLERNRQEQNIELIASENYVSNDVLKIQGSILTNKYAEGYSGKRYYGGCEYIDMFETRAIEYLKELFGCKYANVQPHSGSSANMAVYRALLNHGDKVMGMNLNHGGHIPFGGSFIPATHAISQYCLPVLLGRFGELHAKDGILIQLPTVEMQSHSFCRDAKLRFCQVPGAVLFPVPADAVDLLHAMKNGIRCLAGLLGLFFVGFFVFAAGHPCQAKRE